MSRVIVLMSTYNGEKYLRQQIDSILAQEKVEIELVIRDDGSSDTTIEILKDYSSKYPNVSYYQGKNLKPCKSFMELIRNDYCADYYALADQDDVWDKDKLYVATKMLSEIDSDEPAMYYSNLRIVDADLNFCRKSHSYPLVAVTRFEPLVENLATGCTIVYNKQLHDLLVKNVVDHFSMHDTWIYMTASIFGRTVYDFEPHISYRQHDNNVVGTYKKAKSLNFYWKRILRLFDRSLQPRYDNAVLFYETFGNKIPKDYLEKILKVINYKKSYKHKVRLFFDHDIRANSIEANVRLRLMILLGLL